MILVSRRGEPSWRSHLFCWIPPRKLTWQWQITITSSNGWVFHCHVSFPGCHDSFVSQSRIDLGKFHLFFFETYVKSKGISPKFAKHSGFRNYSTYHYLNLPTLTIFRKWLQPSVGIQSLIRPSLYRSPVINLHGETWILKEWDVWITKDGLGKRCFLWHDEILCNVDVYSHILSIFFWISPAPLLEQKVPSKYFKCKSVQLSWVSF